MPDRDIGDSYQNPERQARRTLMKRPRPPHGTHRLPGAPASLTRRQLIAGGAGAIAVGALTTACGSAPGASAVSSASGKPRRGGNFRVGVAGGSPSDLFDGQNFLDQPDEARIVSMFEPLLMFDDNYQLQLWLAEEVTMENPAQWLIRLRKGIEFSNGKTLQAEDVVYSLRRIADPKNGLAGQTQLQMIDPNGFTILDPYTVRVKLSSPNSVFDQGLGQYYNNIVPTGYSKWPAPQAGTGCYILKSFTPGQQSVSTRNPNYWHSGQPYLDTITIIDFPDDTARANALLGGSIDAMTSVLASQVPAIQAHGGLSLLVSQNGEWLPICMAIDMPPFDNNDVRQAMRLIVDRPTMIEQVLSGYGRVANDLFSPFDPDYDSALPQRHQDLDQAKFLLKRAGVTLNTTLHTTPGEAGMVTMASVFAEQAKGAGVNISVQNDPNYYGNQYLKLAFSVDYWGTRNYLPQVADSMLAGAPFNETHWPPASGPGSNYASLYNQALATTSPSLREQLVHEMQTIEYDYGGYVIPFFMNLIGAYSDSVQGLTASKGTVPLGDFGHGYRTIWFA
jgi:peptide/nickel transport system substrate-binding protein